MCEPHSAQMEISVLSFLSPASFTGRFSLGRGSDGGGILACCCCPPCVLLVERCRRSRADDVCDLV